LTGLAADIGQKGRGSKRMSICGQIRTRAPQQKHVEMQLHNACAEDAVGSGSSVGSSAEPPQGTVELFSRYFDCTGDMIDQSGGATPLFVAVSLYERETNNGLGMR
jgi:hypothetical protein